MGATDRRQRPGGTDFGSDMPESSQPGKIAGSACGPTLLCPVRRRKPSYPNMTSTDTLTDFEREVAQFIVTTLNLEVAPEQIAPLDPLYGDGLGLDSIDVLEVALAVSKQYGFQMRSDDPDNASIFSSLRSLAAHIAKHRA